MRPNLRSLRGQGRLSGETCPPNRRTATTNLRTLTGQIRQRGSPCRPTITEFRERIRKVELARRRGREEREARDLGLSVEELRELEGIDISDVTEADLRELEEMFGLEEKTDFEEVKEMEEENITGESRRELIERLNMFLVSNEPSRTMGDETFDRLTDLSDMKGLDEDLIGDLIGDNIWIRLTKEEQDNVVRGILGSDLRERRFQLIPKKIGGTIQDGIYIPTIEEIESGEFMRRRGRRKGRKKGARDKKKRKKKNRFTEEDNRRLIEEFDRMGNRNMSSEDKERIERLVGSRRSIVAIQRDIDGFREDLEGLRGRRRREVLMEIEKLVKEMKQGRK